MPKALRVFKDFAVQMAPTLFPNLQPKGEPPTCRRLRRCQLRVLVGRDLWDGEVPLSLLPDSPSAPRLGRWRPLRRNAENTALLDLFHQIGDVEPLTSADVVGRSHQAMKEYQAGILAIRAYTPTAQNLKKLADLKPKTLAIMHGSSFTGDCARALDDLNVMFREVFGRQK